MKIQTKNFYSSSLFRKRGERERESERDRERKREKKIGKRTHKSKTPPAKDTRMWPKSIVILLAYARDDNRGLEFHVLCYRELPDFINIYCQTETTQNEREIIEKDKETKRAR